MAQFEVINVGYPLHVHIAGCPDLKTDTRYRGVVRGWLIEGEDVASAIRAETKNLNSQFDQLYAEDELFRAFPCCKSNAPPRLCGNRGKGDHGNTARPTHYPHAVRIADETEVLVALRRHATTFPKGFTRYMVEERVAIPRDRVISAIGRLMDKGLVLLRRRKGACWYYADPGKMPHDDIPGRPADAPTLNSGASGAVDIPLQPQKATGIQESPVVDILTNLSFVVSRLSDWSDAARAMAVTSIGPDVRHYQNTAENYDVLIGKLGEVADRIREVCK